MSYTKDEAIEEIYNTFSDRSIPNGAPEDFVDWAVRNNFPLNNNITRLFETSCDGVYDSLEDYANAMYPGREWQDLVECGYWQGDYSDMVFRPIGGRI